MTLIQITCQIQIKLKVIKLLFSFTSNPLVVRNAFLTQNVLYTMSTPDVTDIIDYGLNSLLLCLVLPLTSGVDGVKVTLLHAVISWQKLP